VIRLTLAQRPGYHRIPCQQMAPTRRPQVLPGQSGWPGNRTHHILC